MIAISSCCPLATRSASRRTDGLAARVGAQPAMIRAWAWWPIMLDMKRTSASVYGYRPAGWGPGCAAPWPLRAQAVAPDRRIRAAAAQRNRGRAIPEG
jgi:hypothetical protein